MDLANGNADQPGYPRVSVNNQANLAAGDAKRIVVSYHRTYLSERVKLPLRCDLPDVCRGLRNAAEG